MKIKRPIVDFLFLIAFFLFGQINYSQDISTVPTTSFEKFSTKDGLSSNVIKDIVQDHEGYIWLATEDGLVRYDGYQFLNYRSIPGDSTSLPPDQPEKLFVDFMGDIWIGSKTGINRYSSDCDCFHRYSSNVSSPNNQQGGQINSFAEDRDSNLWIGTQEGGLFQYIRENDQFTRFLDDPKHPNNLLEDEVRVLLVDKNNHLWIGTGETFDANISGGGLVRLDINTGITKRFLNDPENINSLIDNRISALMEDKDGKLWVGSCQSGLHYYDPKKEEFIRIIPETSNTNSFYAPQGEMGLWSSCPHVKFIHQDQTGEFWVGTYNGGLHHFDPSNRKLSTYYHNPADPGSLSSNQVWSFLQDRQNRLWIGNLPGGLNMVDPSLHKFKIHKNDLENPGSLSANHVIGIYEAPQDSGIIWIGTREGGLNRLDKETGLFTNFRHNQKIQHSIGSDMVWTAYEDRNGTFWVGTEAGLDTLDRRTGKFTPYEILENNTFTKFPFPVIRIHEDRNRNLWLGTWSGGIYRLSSDKKTIKKYQFSNSSQQTFYNSVFAIHEDTRGTLWVGAFHNGLFEYDSQNDVFIPHLEEFGASSINEDSTGLLWVGTIDNGILHYNSKDLTYEQYTSVDGLPSDDVFGVLIDESGNLWISTGKGLARFEVKSHQFTSYDDSDGLPFTSFNHTSAFKSKDGQLFFGGNGGLVSFYPNQVKGNPFPPDVVMSGLQIAGEVYNLNRYKNNPRKRIKLSHQQNDLTFDYVGLHFTKPSKHVYKYRMYPYDSDWINAGNQRTARYTNLNPGEYNFKVIACSSDGIWNEEGATLSFYIAPPWWNRWWAYSLYGILGLGLLYSIYKFQLNRNLEKAETLRLKDLDATKNRLFTNISHEFRTPLMVISGMSSHIQENPDKWLDEGVTIIERNCTRLLELVNQMLDLSKLENGKLGLQLVQSDSILFVKYLCKSFNSLTEESKIKLTFYAEIEELYMDFDPEKLSTIVMNLLSNAIKFTMPGGKIIVHLNRIEKNGSAFFLVKVKDNGSGISEDELENIFDRFYQVDNSSTRIGEGTGIGLALTKELTELMGGSIEVKSILGKGSEFTIQLPISRNEPITDNLLIPYHSRKMKSHMQPIEWVEKVDLPLVLIIEDNEDVASYLKICLEDKYNLIYAKDGEKGIEMACERIPDIIISDVMMPGKDGFEVCSILKNDERTDHIPIILLTAKASVQDRISGLSHGADAYLIKPFHKAELFTRLEQLIISREIMMKKVQQDSYTLFLKKQIEGAEANFLKKTIEHIQQHLSDHTFGSAQLIHKLQMSESQVYRKLKAITGKSTAVFIRSVRLQKAKELIIQGNDPISSIAYEVGFNDPSWFSRAFKEEFGYAPSELSK